MQLGMVHDCAKTLICNVHGKGFCFCRIVGYKLRNQLAAIDFNHHRNREIAKTADWMPRYVCLGTTSCAHKVVNCTN